MIRKLKSSKGGVSRREVLLTVIVLILCFFFVREFFKYLEGQQALGNDALRANTAESVGVIDSDAGMTCPVRGCPGGNCVHRAGDRYIGYFDDVTNTIIGEKTAGYNDSSHPKIEGHYYYGDPHTMVLRVVTGGGTLELNWETGKQ